MESFSAKISIIGINPYVPVPVKIVNTLFKESGKSKGPVPVRGTLNGNKFTQTLVRYRLKWRLYLNTPLRKAAGIDVGDIATVKIEFDPRIRTVPMHPKLIHALNGHEIAAASFKTLTPYRQKEILRYLQNLKTEQSVDNNVEKVILYLTGRETFAGRKDLLQG